MKVVVLLPDILWHTNNYARNKSENGIQALGSKQALVPTVMHYHKNTDGKKR